MEKLIDFAGIPVYVSWEDRLVPGTEVFVHTGDPGLATNIIELFLDEMGKRHLWYQSGWLSYDDHQEVVLTQASKEDWDEWTREWVLSKVKYKDKKRFGETPGLIG